MDRFVSELAVGAIGTWLRIHSILCQGEGVVLDVDHVERIIVRLCAPTETIAAVTSHTG